MQHLVCAIFIFQTRSSTVISETMYQSDKPPGYSYTLHWLPLPSHRFLCVPRTVPPYRDGSTVFHLPQSFPGNMPPRWHLPLSPGHNWQSPHRSTIQSSYGRSVPSAATSNILRSAPLFLPRCEVLPAHCQTAQPPDLPGHSVPNTSGWQGRSRCAPPYAAQT